MYAEAHEKLDRRRLRESIDAHRIAMADAESYSKAIKALDTTTGADRHAPRPKDPKRVSLAEQAKQKRAGQAGRAHGGS